MYAKRLIAVCVLGVLSFVLAGGAVSEVTISLNISGDIDEIIAILRQLERMGLGGDGQNEDGPMKLRIDSVHVGERIPSIDKRIAELKAEIESKSALEPEPEPEPKPVTLAFEDPKAEPGVIAPGTASLVTVRVIDLERRVDTLSATLKDIGQAADLYDNGTNGDEKAGDGVWTALISLPPDAKAGRHDIAIEAFDVNGEPMRTHGEGEESVPLVARTAITLKPKN